MMKLRAVMILVVTYVVVTTILLYAMTAGAATVKQFDEIEGLEFINAVPCYDGETEEGKEPTHMCLVFQLGQGFGIIATKPDGIVYKGFLVIDGKQVEMDPHFMLEGMGAVSEKLKNRPIKPIKPEDMPHNKVAI